MDLADHYDLAYFGEHGFERRQCPTCQLWFWTTDAERTTCGDPPCDEYSFIGSPITSEPLGLSAMRERYLSFLERNGHTRVSRQPVVARWRDDIYLNIASISNYQPHVTGGLIPPPANPLAISQPCIRLNDVDSVGRSGRHLTTFEMMAHHCFNYPEGHAFAPDAEVYFKERTVELCQGFLDEIGVARESVTYKENPWAGGGNAGPAFEVLTNGLEVATLVFMQWEADAAGDIEVKGERYREMDLRIVDTGYGLERFVWASQGTPTIYEAVLPEAVEFLSKHADLDIRDNPDLERVLAEHARLSCLLAVDTGAKLHELREQVAARMKQRNLNITTEDLTAWLRPLEATYAIADHTRCLAFMLGDGIVPSNVRAGYLARLLIRKSLRLLPEAGADVGLYDVVEVHLRELRDDYPELWEARSTIEEVLGLETERFAETMERGRRLVSREVRSLGKGGTLSTDRLVQLYDSHGMPPEVVAEVAAESGVEADVPDDFYQQVADVHGVADDVEAGEAREPPDLPPTELLFYEHRDQREFNATVLWAEPVDDEASDVILDQTAFYPEGGGQPADHGFLFVRDEAHDVVDVRKWGDLVVHRVTGTIKVGKTVKGQVDWGRRQALTLNHTATHVIAGSARSVLGRHVWQSGAQKGTSRSRLDITHYKRISDEEMREIETLANAIVLGGRPVETQWLDRIEAEKKYGFILYQGGVPAGRDIRVVRIPEFDVQACAGTHVAATNDLGIIKVFRTERIQDGVERLEFAAGLAALREIQAHEDLLKASAQAFSVPIEDLPKTADRFFDEWKQYKKEAEGLRAKLATGSTAQLLDKAEPIGDVRLVASRLDLGLDDLVKAAANLAKNDKVVVVLAGVADGRAGIVAARSQDLELDARSVAQAGGEQLGGGGGGKPDLARAGGPNADQVQAALDAAAAAARSAIAG